MEVMSRNVDQIEILVSRASASGGSRPLDIIVFPEYALTGPGFVSRADVAKYAQPATCGDQSRAPVLARLCDIARTHATHLVVHFLEVANSTAELSGRTGKTRFYSTQACIGPSGALLARYRKQHLYRQEALVLDPGAPDTPPAHFSVRGARVEMRLCFDILFNTARQTGDAKPALLVFSTWWVNFPPLLTGTQVQQAWARAFGTGVLASGANSGQGVSSGSGIYDSKGSVLGAIYDARGEFNSTLIIREVPCRGAEGAQPGRWPSDSTSPSRTWTPPTIRGTDGGPEHRFNNTEIRRVNASMFVPGAETVLTASVPGAACEARVRVNRTEPMETYALVAASGLYNGLFPACMCSFLVCPRDGGCLDGDEAEAHTTFASVRVRALSLHGDYTLPQAAANGVQPFSASIAVVTNASDILVESQGNGGTTLVDATLFALMNQD